MVVLTILVLFEVACECRGVCSFIFLGAFVSFFAFVK